MAGTAEMRRRLDRLFQQHLARQDAETPPKTPTEFEKLLQKFPRAARRPHERQGPTTLECFQMMNEHYKIIEQQLGTIAQLLAKLVVAEERNRTP